MARTARMKPVDTRLIAALAAENPSTRLRAALALGSDPEPGDVIVDTLIARCAIEPDFFVRDMLTWALTRFPSEVTVPRLIAELGSTGAQARSQALHTLSKIKAPSAFPAITHSLLRDPDDDVARSAWRAAVVLVPEGQKGELAEELATQFGRGNQDVQRSLSRALVALGAEVVEPVVRKWMASDAASVRAHASATERLLSDPDAGYEAAVHEARRQVALTDRPA
jgi:HEAT repeat protein